MGVWVDGGDGRDGGGGFDGGAGAEVDVGVVLGETGYGVVASAKVSDQMNDSSKSFFFLTSFLSF